MDVEKGGNISESGSQLNHFSPVKVTSPKPSNELTIISTSPEGTGIEDVVTSRKDSGQDNGLSEKSRLLPSGTDKETDDKSNVS